MNYGSLGSAVAHEISHIFTIAEYRSQGDLRDYWSPQSILKYVRNVECLSKQYATFYVPETGRHVSRNCFVNIQNYGLVYIVHYFEAGQ